jgi:hypothetical protein
MNWFLYIITEDFIDDEGKKVKKGEAGVGQCSMSPGISDAYNGMMYVVSGEHIINEVKKSGMTTHPSAYKIREMIENFYNNPEVIEISKDDKDFFIE